MKKILLPIIIVLLLCSFNIIAQQNAVLRQDGSIEYLNKGNKEVIPLSKVPTDYALRKNSGLNSIMDVDDTLGYGHLFPPNGANFGFYGQDRMVMWFKAPVDMIIHSAGFNTYPVDGNTDNQECRLKLVKFEWNMDSINTQSEERLGYYESITGGGAFDWTAYLDDPDRTGDWISINGQTSPFGHDIWSDNGIGVPVIPDDDLPVTEYQWVDMDVLGFEPEVPGGTIVGLSMKNTDFTSIFEWGHRVGFWSTPASGIGMPPTYKFYNLGRFIPYPSLDADVGWWSRDYTWDFVLAVVLTGDLPPSINSYTIIHSGLVSGPFIINANITDTNPGDSTQAGVAGASIYFSNDSGMVWTEIPMSGSEPDFTGEIPPQSPGSTISYKIIAADINGNTSTTPVTTFHIFSPSGANTLVVFNGFNRNTGLPQDYYFGPEIKNGITTFAHDTWSYGALTADLVELYDNILEICTNGPDDYNDSVIVNWLVADGNRNYFLAGQEWLGMKNDFVDSTYIEGDFEYDVLGITYNYNNVSYEGSNSNLLPTLLFPQQGTMFGGPLYDLFNQNPTDSMQYDPVREIGDDNWIDAFDVIEGQQVDMKLETRGIGGVPEVDTLNCATHRVLPGGNKIVFLSYDPYSINSSPDYIHYGYTNENTPYQALLWFGIPLGVKGEIETKPEGFRLLQNYPNPFNPTTKIKYTIPSVGTRDRVSVQIIVYDVLGNEIATLVNEGKPAGEYEVKFDATGLPSGVYFYQLKAGSFIQTKKMVVIK